MLIKISKNERIKEYILDRMSLDDREQSPVSGNYHYAYSLRSPVSLVVPKKVFTLQYSLDGSHLSLSLASLANAVFTIDQD